ncbi:oxidoreductase [Kordiimonas sp. SCSIO 12603]|uniref:NAD(P)/FAD-dependent oxidoreductase n=1 Tax=Kordiimonas sp. SCSIO 12603 TaxID=2829596 RepID=UPI0021045E8C|nr:FAD-dependent oxidoreductase [Kordiimonas sp. SCSIO 12603]UTW58155.1 oxidoreductase [Kordiimonas sp. SCSIO 12603]
MTHIVIIGGGHAAAQAVTSLRQKKFDGEVTLITDEGMIPYQRPPLSKMYLSGEITVDRLPILRDSAYEGMGVDVKLNTRAIQVDKKAKTVSLDSGETVPYDKLVLATGGRARKLTCEGSDLAGIHYVRTIADTDKLKPEFEAAQNILVIGGGYIGLEAAAVARKFGKTVTVLEAEGRILQRVVAPEVSAFYTQIHTEEGAQILTNQMVTSIEGTDRVSAVHTKDGSRFECDLIIAGIGLIANSEIAEKAGLETHPAGIYINEFCQTSDEDIYAVGDVAWFEHPIYKREMRIESVQNAVDQAKTAILHILGEEKPYAELPWFWSDQYGLKLQIAGLSEGYDDLITRGDTSERSAAFFYMKEDKIIAVDCVGRIAEFMQSKKLIPAGIAVDRAVLEDDSKPFKEIAAELLA